MSGLHTPSLPARLFAAGRSRAHLLCHGPQRLIAVLRLWRGHALNSTNRLSPSFGLADDLSVFHDEPATHQGMSGYTGDFHAFEWCNLAARLELIRRDRICAIEIDERDVGIRAGQQSAFGGI